MIGLDPARRQPSADAVEAGQTSKRQFEVLKPWLNGEAVYRVLPEIHIYYVVRAGLGLMIFSSAVLGFYNIARTLFGKTGASS